MTHEQLTAVIIRYKENAQLAEAIEAEQAEIREQLKLELADRNTTCLDVGVHRVKLAGYPHNAGQQGGQNSKPCPVRPVQQDQHR